MKAQSVLMANDLPSTKTLPRQRLFDSFLVSFSPTTTKDRIAAALSAIAQAVNVEAGGTVPLSPAGDALVYVGSGATKLIASASSGREQIVAFHFMGDLVSIPTHAWHSYRLCALVDTEVLSFGADEFLKIVGAEPVFLNSLLERSLAALHRCRDKAVGLGRKNAGERLASFLVNMADRIGSAQGGQCHLDLPMSRRDIGDSLGLTIETVSRQFSELRTAGLLETTGRSRVLVRDLAGLTKLAAHI